MAGKEWTTMFLGKSKPNVSLENPARSIDMAGIPTVTSPVSLLSGVFTYGIPAHKYRTTNLGGGDGTATSVDGALRISSGTVDGGITRFESKDHPRYVPDRMFGAVCATPGFPVEKKVIFRMGLFTPWNGMYLQVDCSTEPRVVKMYSRTTTGVVAPGGEDHSSGLSGATTDDILQATCVIPRGSNLDYATLLDIWGQWRGVGNLRALIDVNLAGTTDRLGTASNFWTRNPALPFAIEMERKASGDNAYVDIGCFDVSSYGAGPADWDDISLPSGSVALDATERPLIVFQAAGFLAGMPCTRDHRLERILSLTADFTSTVRIRRNPTISNANVTWSIPDSTRGIVQGIGSVTATTTGGDVLWSRAFATNDKIDLTDLPKYPIRPIPGTLTTSTNRGNPAYGEIIAVTVQRSVAGTVNASCTPVLGSLY